MQAIETKYIPPTNTRGSRIKAYCQRGALTIPYPEGDQEEAHRAAAFALCHKFQAEDVREYGSDPNARTYWNPARLVTGCTRDGFAHVFLPMEAQR
jgi:hypothetical protein